MRFAQWVFRIAGVYGLIVILAGYFSAPQVSRDYPPAITHYEYYFGFFGVALAWQFAFLVIARDPARYRPLMPVALLEKLSFFIPSMILWSRGQLPPPTGVLACIDMTLGVLFAIAWIRTKPTAAAS